jgi:hypothetical protein
MSAEGWSLKNTTAAFIRGWHSFFHAPCDARICAAVRIAYASIVLIHFAVLYPDLELWFGETGVLPRETLDRITNPYKWSILRLLPPTMTAVRAGFWIVVAHAVALLIGLLPRVNAFFLFMWLISFQVRNDIINDGEDCLMRVLGFFMIWLPSGQCWSVQALIRKWWHPVGAANSADRYAAPGWPLRLFQFEMAAMLFSSGLMKLSGEPWFNGTALYYVSRLDDHFGRFPVPAWAFDTPWIVALMTWSVLIAELAIPILIWFRETRLPCLAVLLVFHLANEWTMNLFLFHWLMLAGWISFLRPEDFGWLSPYSTMPSSSMSKMRTANGGMGPPGGP